MVDTTGYLLVYPYNQDLIVILLTIIAVCLALIAFLEFVKIVMK